jgi:hypothetical protein
MPRTRVNNQFLRYISVLGRIPTCESGYKEGRASTSLGPGSPPHWALRMYAHPQGRVWGNNRVATIIFDLEPISSPRPAVLQSRRAQEVSRLAVAPTLRHTLALPGHTLTASSTAALLGAVGMTIRGEPAFRARINRATTLYSVGPGRPEP